MWKVLLFSLTVVAVCGGVIIWFTMKKKKLKKQEESREHYLDRLTTTPAEISIKTVEGFIKETIESYISAYYNLNPQLLPQKITQDLYIKTYNDMKRQYDIGLRNKLLEYKPIGRYKIVQNNSSIYAVTELNVHCHYTVKYLSYHATFKKCVEKTVKQTITFVGTNQEGFLMHEVSPETIESIKEESIE